MSDSAELQGEEQAPVARSKRLQTMYFVIGIVSVLGGFGIWLTWPTSNDVVEVPQELEDIAAAAAPAIVPTTNESAIDVPTAGDLNASPEPSIAGPAYIPPAVNEPSVRSDSLAMPEVELLTASTASYEERRSRLLDALHASPVVEFEPIVDDVESEPASSRTASKDVADKRHALTPGAVIPSVLVQGINTDLPGIAVAQVSRDVFDSNTGTRLLIPRGSRVFGTYGSEPPVSDQRVLVTWERIDLPNGNTLDLQEAIGADQSGNAGLKDQVHRRTGRALTVTGLTSLITAGLAHASNANDPAVLRETALGHLVEEPSLRADATRAVAQQYGDLVSRIAEQHLDRGPTLTVRPGYEFAIQIAEEISLNPYLP